MKNKKLIKLLRYVINTKSQSLSELNSMVYGVGKTRRGWLEAKNVLNTGDISEVLKFCKK